MRIVKFNDRYAENVSDLIRRCLTDVNSKDYPKRVINFMCDYFQPERIIDRSADSEVFVAIEHAKVIGTATLNKNLIQAVFVDPKLHGTGVGSKLMAKVEQLARERGYSSVKLSSSLTALGFYKRLGYRNIREKNEEGFGRSILMSKEL